MKLNSLLVLLCGSTLISSVLAGSATLSENGVAQIAAKAAQKKDYKLEDFTTPEVKFEKSDETWWVAYKGKSLKPGNYFYVLIADKTKKTEVYDGE